MYCQYQKHGLLDDKDKEDFFEKNLFISPTTEAALIDEEFVAYIALTRAREKTYISYSLLDKSFKENFFSIFKCSKKFVSKFRRNRCFKNVGVQFIFL